MVDRLSGATFAEESTMLQPEEAHAVDAATRGTDRARERLVAEYLPVVRAIALRYRAFGLPVDDLVQEGSLGLLEAVDHFDPARGSDFEAYARFRIRRAIRNALTDQSRLIRLPKQVVERRRAIEQAGARIKCVTGHDPTPAEIAEATGLTAAVVIATRNAGTPPVSLDQPVLDDGSPLEALIVDASAPDPEAETVAHEQEQEIDKAVATLPERQREILSRHFGLGRDVEQIADVAAEFHVSQQRARAIERGALYALRDRLDPPVSPQRAR